MFHNLVQRGHRAIPALQDLLMHGSPAARLYGAIGLHFLDPVQGRLALEGLCHDSGQLRIQAGGRIGQHTVSEMAYRFLQNADSLRFFQPRR